MAREVSEGIALAPQNTHYPAWPGDHVEQVCNSEAGRNGQAVPDVAMALPQHLKVDGHHQGAASGSRGAFDERANETAIPHHVKLKPEWFGSRRRHILDRADGHGAERVGNAGLVRSEERRVGKEGRCGWSRDHEKK